MDDREPEDQISIRDIIREVDRLRKMINSQRGAQLHSLPKRDEIRNIVKLYFRSVRPPLLRSMVDVAIVDSAMQRLLELASRNSTIAQYKKCVAGLSANLNALEAQVELQMSDREVQDTRNSSSPVERQILTTLSGMLPPTARSYQQVLLDLSQKDRASYRGTATELREILRETLDYLAPDKDVVASQGFELEKDRTKPTMAQKARYILRSRGIPKNSIDVPKKAIDIVEGTVSSLVRSTYDRGSIDTHTSTGINRPGVMQLKMYVDSVLSELLEIHGK
jgi:small-conductance mechanosensitive channel